MAIWTIAKTTVGEQMRKKVLNVCLIVAVAMIVLSLSFRQFEFAQDMTIVKSLGLFVILLAGFIISLLLSVSLIPNEVERRTIYTILSKPVKRYEFVLGKFLGGLITLSANIGLMGAVFVIMVAIKAGTSEFSKVAGGPGGDKAIMHPQLFDPNLVLGIVLIYFQFLLLSAVVMLFSIIMAPTVNFFASSAVYVVGSAAQIWKSVASDNATASIFVKGLYKVIYTVMPNFDYFNVQNKLIHPNVEVRDFPTYIAQVIAYALLYSVVVMIAAVLIFDRKEV